MAHERKQIRDKIKNLLLAAGTQAGSNIFSNRMLSYFKTELPSINVLTFEEDNEKRTESPRELQRNLQVKIEIRVKELEDPEDKLDEISEEIEDAIEDDFFTNNPFFDLDFVEDFWLKRTEGGIEIKGEQQTGLQILYYDCQYITQEPPNKTVKDDVQDLNRIDVETEQPPIDQDIDATDIIDNLQA